MKRQFALDRQEVRVIGRDHTGADTPCGESDQYVKGQLAQLGGLVVFSPPEPSRISAAFSHCCSIGVNTWHRRRNSRTNFRLVTVRAPLSNSWSTTEEPNRFVVWRYDEKRGGEQGLCWSRGSTIEPALLGHAQFKIRPSVRLRATIGFGLS